MLHTSNIQLHRTCTPIPRRRNEDTVRKYWAKDSRSHIKSSNAISDVKRLRWLFPSNSAAYNTHSLFSWLLPVYSPWQMFKSWHFQHHGCNPGFTVNSLQATSRDSLVTCCPASGALWYFRKKNSWPLHHYLFHAFKAISTWLTVLRIGGSLGWTPAPGKHLCISICVLSRS